MILITLSNECQVNGQVYKLHMHFDYMLIKWSADIFMLDSTSNNKSIRIKYWSDEFSNHFAIGITYSRYLFCVSRMINLLYGLLNINFSLPVSQSNKAMIQER